MALKEIIANCEASNPGLKIAVETQAFDALTGKVLAASNTGDAPDVTWMTDSDLSKLDSAGALTDLNTLLPEDFQSTVIPDLLQPMADKAVFNGIRVALPIWPNAGTVLFYRKDLLKTIGLTEPPTDWAELAEAAAKLSNPAENQYGLALPLVDTTDSALRHMITGFGPEALDADTGKFDLTGENAKRAAALMRQLVESGAMPKDMATASLDDVQDQFASGRFAMALAYAPRFATFRTSATGYAPEDLGIAKLPSFDGNPQPTTVTFWNLGVPVGAKNPDGAVAFLDCVYSPESSLIWAKVGQQLPDRQSVLSDEYFTTPEAADLQAAAAIANSPGTVTLPQNLADASTVFDQLNKASQQLVTTDDEIDGILETTKGELGW
ncbi:MAG: extracellular solute-binding protein [Actinomycetota bacterium]|nr:extracellular solute-binding protein [Actinomycetota bacterium]